MSSAGQPGTIAGHIAELRMRLFWCAGALLIFTVIGWSQQKVLLRILQAPLHDQLYYTSPTGGFSFIFKIAVAFGFICTLPLITYHVIRFIGPAFHLKAKTIIFFLLSSAFLAFGGVAFAYFLSLPAALHFLTGFGGGNITALITADEYFNFALAYVLGFAALFQLPLIISVINRFTPLTPRKMMHAQRYIILGSFIVAAILTPTPDPLNQTIMAAPVVVLYQFAVIWVWIKSHSPAATQERKRKRPNIEQLRTPVASQRTPVAAPAPYMPTPQQQSVRPRQVLSVDGMAPPRYKHDPTFGRLSPGRPPLSTPPK